MSEKDYDNRMHSAEHILNSVMDKMFFCGRAFSTHIEKKKSKCDYRVRKMITADEIREVERTVNEIIRLDVPVDTSFVTRAEAEARYFTGKLPVDAGDNIRIVKIGNFDACPCIGPHVKSTREIGHFYITTTDYNENILRIRFKLDDK
jgi:misacylated tRNA(Ala) deacylase